MNHSNRVSKGGSRIAAIRLTPSSLRAGRYLLAVPLPFGFIGGIDGGNGLWKLGARFYDSCRGGFIQQDRYMGNPGDPLSLNRYVYCELDPVNFIVPTGFDVSAPGCDGHGENSGYNVSQSVTHNSDGSFSTSYTYHSSDGSSHQSTYGFNSQGNMTCTSNSTTSGFTSQTTTTFYNITRDQASLINKSLNSEVVGAGVILTAFGFAEGFAFISAVATTTLSIGAMYREAAYTGDTVTYSHETNCITTFSSISINGKVVSSGMNVIGWN